MLLLLAPVETKGATLGLWHLTIESRYLEEEVYYLLSRFIKIYKII